MRIGQVARIVGISARSIRHYHRLGVLAEPDRTVGGYREYDIADLARIARIAFLSESGVPLKDIRAMLEPGGSDPRADLDALRAGIDRQIEALVRKRKRLDAIAERAAAGLTPGLLPEPVAQALDLCVAEAADDPQLAAVVDRGRDMLDLAALSGDFPDELAAAYTALATAPARRRDYLAMLAGFQQLESRRPADVEPEVSRLVETLLADEAIRGIISGAPADVHDLPTGPTLEQLLPDPAQREVLQRTSTALGGVPMRIVNALAAVSLAQAAAGIWGGEVGSR